MKSTSTVKIMCSLLISVAPLSATAAEPADPLGAWIEKNAARYGLYVERPVKKVEAGRPLQSKGALQVPASMVHSVSNPAANPAANSVPANPTASESDAIEAFFVNGVFDVPAMPPGATLLTAPGTPDLPPYIPLMPIPEIVIEPKAFVPPAAAMNSTSAAAQISAVMKDLDFSEKCSGFATPTGFGTWGKAVIRELTGGNGNSLLQGTDDLRRACPNYDYLTIPQKSHVWVNILMSMSMLESTCNPRALGRGPDGVAAGLLQLHQGHEHKAAPGCNRGDSRSAITSLQCTISIIEKQIKRTDAVFSRDTHFGTLRPQGDLIRLPNGKLVRIVKARVVVGGMKELPLCRRN